MGKKNKGSSNICRSCKKPNEVNANYCQNCGTNIAENWITALDKKIIGYLVSIVVSIVSTLLLLSLLEII